MNNIAQFVYTLEYGFEFYILIKMLKLVKKSTLLKNIFVIFKIKKKKRFFCCEFYELEVFKWKFHSIYVCRLLLFIRCNGALLLGNFERLHMYANSKVISTSL